ncbi:MAG: PIN domain-containing protein [Nitrospira sp. ST-bin4]|nr:MAG: PIN domain-containing protein [Nitrospira sp. ST-bin4]
MIGLDTNVLVRYLVRDNPDQAQIAAEAIARDCTRESPAFINRIVLCELVWVLESAYGYSKETIIGVLEKVFRTAQFQVEDVQTAWTAFRLYQKGKADFSDCLLGTVNRERGCERTITFDQDAGKLAEFDLL